MTEQIVEEKLVSPVMTKMEEIKQRVIDNPNRLVIARVPIEIKKEFTELANSEEFLGDYRFCLKWLLDYRKGLLSNQNEALQAQVDMLNEELVEMKGMVLSLYARKDEQKTRRMSNGRTVPL